MFDLENGEQASYLRCADRTHWISFILHLQKQDESRSFYHLYFGCTYLGMQLTIELLKSRSRGDIYFPELGKPIKIANNSLQLLLKPQKFQPRCCKAKTKLYNFRSSPFKVTWSPLAAVPQNTQRPSGSLQDAAGATANGTPLRLSTVWLFRVLGRHFSKACNG